MPSTPRFPKLHVFLAHQGVCSRRKAEELIVQGRVRVNKQVVTNVAERINPKASVVEVDGEKVTTSPAKLEYWMVHKPVGVVSTVQDPDGKRVVTSLVNSTQRLFPVGRLDEESEGLLLLTNDGALANSLTHPRFGVAKTYVVDVTPPPSAVGLLRLRSGVPLKDGKTAPCTVRVLEKSAGTATLEFTLKEGRNRQVRRMCAAVNCDVRRLRRIRFGALELGSLPVGAARPLTTEERQAVLRLRRKAQSSAL